MKTHCQAIHKPPQCHADPYQVYEKRKHEWIAQNPNAMPVEYDRAMRRIANELGV